MIEPRPTDWVYDIETYPNVFTFTAIHALTGTEFYAEISDVRDDRRTLYDWLVIRNRMRDRLVGYNNIGFDYPVIHEFINTVDHCTANTLYREAMTIINGNDRFSHIIWEKDRHVIQLDLFKINHFDNVARSVSLKVLEINMRSQNVEDLPFVPGATLSPSDIPTLRKYNRHDVLETLKFYKLNLDKIAFREKLTQQYGRDFLNHNDTKIGKDYFIMVLEQQKPGICYDGRQPRQTIRHSIDLGSLILPYVAFTHPEFNRVLDYFKRQTITETKGVFNGLCATVDDFDYHFGVGGIHGSLKWATVKSDDDNVVIDLDVASYYPNLAIANNLYPEHLGAGFCAIYKDLYEQRKQHAKGTAENAMLKLALNGVYGDSNNQYSPFYDPAYTMAITINGQLLLCMLAEQLRSIPELSMIQINTDGLTVRIPRAYRWYLDELASNWEHATGLTLESADYSAMWIRDVNNYVAQYTDGKLKRKGAYEYDGLDWHKNHSALIVPRAAVEYIVNRVPIAETIGNCLDPFDFMITAKCPRSNHILHGTERVQSTNRYFVSNRGEPLIKVAPPVKGAKIGQYKRKNGISDALYTSVLAEVGDNWDERIHTKNKSRYEERRTEYQKGYVTTLCNDADHFDWSNLNYNWYIRETQKLLEAFSFPRI